MTDTTNEAPERIWLTRDESYWENDLGVVFTFQNGSHDVEYVRADRIEQLAATNEELQAENAQLKAKLAAAKQEGFEGGMITAMKVVSSIGYGENHDVDKGYEEAFSAIKKYYADWKAAAPPSQN